MFVCILSLLILLPLDLPAADSPPTNSPAAKAEETTSQELRTYLQLQEQLHATQLAIERTRKEAADLAAQNNETIAGKLQGIEQSLSAQRARELDAMQASNRVMLTVAGAFAGIGFIAMLLMAYFQWKTISRLAELSTALPHAALPFGEPRPLRALGQGDNPIIAAPAAEPSPSLLESVQRLEKRLAQLEHFEPSITEDAIESSASDKTSETPNGTADSATTTSAARITSLLNKGQSLLNLEKAEDALGCFDEALQIETNNAEALVKKGTALEKLRKLNEAVECYDRAIAADGGMTIAYLYKGGVFNRMEKFSEALECYEQALRTQEKRRA